MGRRAIFGDYGRAIPHTEHGYPDEKLMTGGQYGRHRGVSRNRVMKNFQQQLIDRHLFSNGQPGYYPPVTDEQWQEQSDPSHVTIPTRGQRARGMDGDDVQAMAGDFSPLPEPGSGAPPQDKQPDKPHDKTKAILGQARAKSLILKGQLDELKILEARGVLANRQTLARRVVDAAQITRDRVMGVSDFSAPDMYAAAHAPEQNKSQRIHEMIRLLNDALIDALVGVCDEEIERLNR